MKLEHIAPDVFEDVELILKRDRTQISVADVRTLWFFVRTVWQFEKPAVLEDPTIGRMVRHALFMLHRDRNSRCHIDPFREALELAQVGISYRQAMKLKDEHEQSAKRQASNGLRVQ